MKRSVCIAGLTGLALATTGCVQKIDLDVTAIEMVAGLPIGETNIQGEQDLRIGNLKIAEAGFVRVQFRTNANLRRDAVDLYTIAYVQPCGRLSGDEPEYIVRSSIFAADDGSYTAFFPARLDLLVRQDPTGGFKLGWPEAALANGLCFQVSGLSMLQFGLKSGEIKLDRMTELLKRQ